MMHILFFLLTITPIQAVLSSDGVVSVFRQEFDTFQKSEYGKAWTALDFLPFQNMFLDEEFTRHAGHTLGSSLVDPYTLSKFHFGKYIDSINFLPLRAEDMPSLFAYITMVAEENNIAMPLVLFAADESSTCHVNRLDKDLAVLVITSRDLLHATEEELKFVLAHEMGHLKYQHVDMPQQLRPYAVVLPLLVLYEFSRNYLIRKRCQQMSSAEQDALTTRPSLGLANHGGLMLYCLGVYCFTRGVMSAFSRFNERQADAFAARYASQGGVSYFSTPDKKYSKIISYLDQQVMYAKNIVKLGHYSENLNTRIQRIRNAAVLSLRSSDPSILKKIRTWFSNLFSSHPSDAERVASLSTPAP